MPCQCSCDCSKFNGYKWISRGSAEEHWAECPLLHCVGPACTRSEEDFYRFLEIKQRSRSMSVCSEDCMALYSSAAATADDDGADGDEDAPTATVTPADPVTEEDDEEDRLRHHVGTTEEDDAASYFLPNSDSDSDSEGEDGGDGDSESDGGGDCDCDECTGASSSNGCSLFQSIVDEVGVDSFD